MIGVLKDGLLVTTAGGEQQLVNQQTGIPFHPYLGFWNLEKLLDLAEQKKLAQLWIARESDFWQNIQFAHKRDAWAINDFWQGGRWTIGKGERKNTVTGWIDGQYGIKRQIVIPGLADENWPFDDDPRSSDPYVLATAIEFFQEKTGQAPTFPFQVSRKIFDATQSGPFELLTDDPETYWQPFIDNTKSEIIWHRQPTAKEKKNKFAYAFDKRMMFLAAARSALFGVGHYETIENVYFDPSDKKTVGLAQIEKPEFFDNEFTRFIQDIFPDQDWFYLQHLSVFQEFCKSPIRIKKLYYWNNPARIFEKFAIRIGTAIKETRGSDLPEIQICNGALKRLYTNFFGWFGRSVRPIPKYGAELFRPDWRGVIVSMAIVNLLRNILEVYRKTEKLPFAIDHDCVIYAADNAIEFEGTVLDDLNRFSVEWTLPIKAAIAAVSGDDGGATKLDSIGKKSEAERSVKNTVGASNGEK